MMRPRNLTGSSNGPLAVTLALRLSLIEHSQHTVCVVGDILPTIGMPQKWNEYRACRIAWNADTPYYSAMKKIGRKLETL